MLSPKMEGPFSFTQASIDANVHQEAIGIYALWGGALDKPEIRYIGRSDTSLNERLKDHLGEIGYESFSFSTVETTIDAYNLECILYHHYGNDLENSIHPAKPQGHPLDLKCYYCKV